MSYANEALKEEEILKQHGGDRSGSGRKRQFENPTIINFKCELSDKLAAKEKHGKQLNKMFIEWLKSLQPDSNA